MTYFKHNSLYIKNKVFFIVHSVHKTGFSLEKRSFEP
jgi:hypothetical protein